jgi:predicted nucleotidyltransferase
VNDLLRNTLADVVAFLRDRDVSYALVGGLAASIRGQTRVTVDVDMVIDADVQSGLAMAATLEGSQFQPLFTGIDEVIERAFIVPLRHRTTGVKVDLALGMTGFEKQLLTRADVLELAGCQVAVASPEDLIIMKTLAARPQDEQDLRGIAIAQGKRLDWNYCMRVSQELGDAIGQDLTRRIAELHEKYAD